MSEQQSIEAREEQYVNLLSEGDLTGAAKLRTEINQQLKMEAANDVVQTLRIEGLRASVTKDFNDAVSEVVEKYPFLDEGEAADSEAIDSCLAWRDHLIRKGVAPGTALRQAAERAARERSTLAESSGDDDADEEETSARRGRPRLRDIADMPEADFDALSDDDKKRLRGD